MKEKEPTPEEKRREKFSEVFDELYRMVHKGEVSDIFNNGKDATQGLTLKGNQLYRDMLTEAGLGPKHDPEEPLKPPPVNPVTPHPKRDYWTRPGGGQ